MFYCFSADPTYTLGISSQVFYKNNESRTEIYYENIIQFEGKFKAELFDLLKKFLTISDFVIRYQDDYEIYATGKFEARYRSRFLFFFNTQEFNCLYDLKKILKITK
ncbi:MAG: hypothetical protein HYU67_04345 [Flavobacteriia bacterium]|nr:hypothetical protein [Flavobacteriia bacterium]